MKIQNFDTKKNIFLIAEIGNNHEGNFKLAKKLIFLAKKNGADAVKFQFIKPEKLINPKNNDIRIKQLKKFCLSWEQILKLKTYSKKINIIFLCSIFDLETLKKNKKKFAALKIPSGDNNIFEVINEYLKTKKPILFSTGMMSMEMINSFLKKIKRNKNFSKKKLCLMHCVSNYPLESSDSNMNSIKSLKNTGLEIGYSDHAVGIENCLVAASLGARIIEKHFTLSNNFSSFRDHIHSANPKQLEDLSKKLKKINIVLGNDKKIITKNEAKNIKSTRRGVYASKKLFKNSILKKNDLILLRPETKVKLNEINKLIGKKIKKNLNKFDEIKLSSVIK